MKARAHNNMASWDTPAGVTRARRDPGGPQQATTTDGFSRWLAWNGRCRTTTHVGRIFGKWLLRTNRHSPRLGVEDFQGINGYHLFLSEPRMPLVQIGSLELDEQDGCYQDGLGRGVAYDTNLASGSTTPWVGVSIHCFSAARVDHRCPLCASCINRQHFLA